MGHERFPNLVAGMAYRGDWQPVVRYLQEAIRTQTGVRDYLEGEKVVQAFLAAHFGLALVFHGWDLVACESVGA